jgi:type II secretory pathway pseudopilin PulG
VNHKKNAPSPQLTGITFVEIVVAISIMLVLASATVHLFRGFSSSFLSSRQRDSIQTLILNDSGVLRQLVKEYCRIPQAGNLTSCTGTIPLQDWNGAYNPDDTANGDCDQNRLAAAMVSANPEKFPSSHQLDVSSNSIDLKHVTITRLLHAQGNELSISYTTAVDGRVVARTTTTLVTPAIGWCP